MRNQKSIVFMPGGLGRIHKIGIVGAGDVVKRMCRAIEELRRRGYRLDDVFVCSLERQSPLDGFVHAYHPTTQDSFLPFDWLHERKAISKDTLWIIATPSEWHAHYALQLAGLCRVAIEKPIAAESCQAKLLLPLTNSDSDVYPIDHKLFNVSQLALVDQCRVNPKLLEQVTYIDGFFYERAGFSQGRQQEDSIRDVQWHLLTCLVACYKTVGVPFEVTVDAAHAGIHAPDPDERFAEPTVWSASRIAGRITLNGRQVHLDLRQAKGAPYDRKGLFFTDSEGRIVCEADLNESGWQAHTRVIQALLQPVVDMRHTLSDAIAVMHLVDQARAIAVEMGEYRFGSLPDFLMESYPSDGEADRLPAARPSLGHFAQERDDTITLAYIAEHWIKKLASGEVKYDPCKVESRWVASRESNSAGFKVILNGNRKDRLEKKAA